MSDQRHLPPEALDEWTRAACAELGLSRADVDISLVLDLARDIAHGVARPAAPLTTFLTGLAAGRSTDPDAARAAIAKVTALAEEWDA
ncbi:hypothetical protein GCM10010915_21930 [Microbacterium faecale]|uniref:DUF6457 domain-containing protein n=1 Tax=Microbacterium faecale TaxID=1804630 RepID=A0A916YD35_9MICO|nr:DUF6457 domain-containing protein [Microbacterium faecale]GGD40707.1 hypothetical protein GCM10010915_21930 [Microbacterium faecale]